MKMTHDIDLNAMTTNKEIIQEYTDTILDLFIWAIGEAAVTEMSITVRDNNPEKIDRILFHSLFRLHFIAEQSRIHGTAKFTT